MRVLLFGATGMVGQGVLRECLRAPDVAAVTVIGRHPTGRVDAKLRERQHADFLDLSALADALAGQDACLFCLGISSAGRSEAEYTRITHGYTLAAAAAFAGASPGACFVYLSGAGAGGRAMWARVRSRAERDLLALPLRAYTVRPAYIAPINAERSRDFATRAGYALLRPVDPLLRRLLPDWTTTTEALGRAMLSLVRHGNAAPIVESRDIARLAALPTD